METHTVPDSTNIVEAMIQAVKLLKESEQEKKVVVMSPKAMELCKDRITALTRHPYLKKDEFGIDQLVEFETAYMLDGCIQVFLSFHLKPGHFSIITKREYEQLKTENKI